MTESNPSGEQPIWARPEPAMRQPRFSRRQIASAALAIADADGFEAVTMRRIARALGAGTMSLYRYIATRDDLLALMGDALLGEALVTGELPAGWRDALAAVARRTRAAYLRHPWAVGFLENAAATRATMSGPNGLRHVEQSLAALATAPMDDRTKLDILAIVDDYVFGSLLRTAQLRQQDTSDADADRDGGGTGSPQSAGFLATLLESGEFPLLAALAGAAGAPPGAALPGAALPGAASALAATSVLAAATDPAHLDTRFELGLRLLLDGVAATCG